MPSGGWSGNSRSTRLQRLPPGWYRRIRPLVFDRYGDICHICRLPGADQVDHVVQGDDHSLENLRPIHRHPCHERKSAQEGVAGRIRRQADLKQPPEAHPGLL